MFRPPLRTIYVFVFCRLDFNGSLLAHRQTQGCARRNRMYILKVLVLVVLLSEAALSVPVRVFELLVLKGRMQLLMAIRLCNLCKYDTNVLIATTEQIFKKLTCNAHWHLYIVFAHKEHTVHIGKSIHSTDICLKHKWLSPCVKVTNVITFIHSVHRHVIICLIHVHLYEYFRPFGLL